MGKSFIKDADSTLDYVFDWSEWLGTNTISSYEVIVPEGLTKESDSQADGKVTVWLSGGACGERYTVTCRITTSAGRIEDRSMVLQIMDR